MSALVKKNWNADAHCYEVLAGGQINRVWFDRRLRLWTIQRVDANGDQVGHCHYTPSRTDAERDIGGAA